MVGAAVACSLGGSSLKVVVIESSPPPPFAPDQPHDLRVSALSIASKNILETVGAWRVSSVDVFVHFVGCAFGKLRAIQNFAVMILTILSWVI